MQYVNYLIMLYLKYLSLMFAYDLVVIYVEKKSVCFKNIF